MLSGWFVRIMSPQRVASLLMGLAMLALSGHSWAQITCTGTSNAYTISMPASVAVSRDATAGTLLTGWFSSPAVTNWYSCNGNASNSSSGTGFKPLSLTLSGVMVTANGVSTTVFNTNVPGVGVAVQFRIYTNACGWNGSWLNLGTPGTQFPSSWYGGSCNGSGLGTDGGQAQAALVTTGQVTPGITSGGTLFQAAGFMQSPGSGSFTQISPGLQSFSLTPTAITVLACVTPNVLVPMGSHRANEFTGVGSGTTTVPVSINLNSCPGGMNSIQYRIDAVTSVVNSAQSVVALDSNSTATGIGVQLMNSAGTAAFPLSSYQSLSGYNRATGGNYTVNLKARYYQAAASISPGLANASMTFTMQYQ
jgi:major type 1 subunit fimbrin (pilin)